jgi:hypothetical protein
MDGMEKTDPPVGVLIQELMKMTQHWINDVMANQTIMNDGLTLSIENVMDLQNFSGSRLATTIEEVKATQKSMSERLIVSINEVKASQHASNDILTKFMNCFSSTVFVPTQLEQELSNIKIVLNAISIETSEFRTLQSALKSQTEKMVEQHSRIGETAQSLQDMANFEYRANEILKLIPELKSFVNVDTKVEASLMLLNLFDIRVDKLEDQVKVIRDSPDDGEAGSQTLVEVSHYGIRQAIMGAMSFVVYSFGILIISMISVVWFDSRFPGILS